MKITLPALLLFTIFLSSSCTKDFVCECSIIESDGFSTYTHSTYTKVRGKRINLGDECPSDETYSENGITINKYCGLQ